MGGVPTSYVQYGHCGLHVNILSQASRAKQTLIVAQAHLEYDQMVGNVSAEHAGWLFAVSDGDANTCVLGDGWYVFDQTGRYANLIGFDVNHARKHHLPIVSAACVIQVSPSQSVFVIVHEAVMTKEIKRTLISEFQVREAGNKIDSVSRRHRHVLGPKGQLCVIVGSASDAVKVNFHAPSVLMGYFARAPTIEEFEGSTMPRFELTLNTPWDPSAFYSDGMDSITPLNNASDAAMIQTITTTPVALFNSHSCVASDVTPDANIAPNAGILGIPDPNMPPNGGTLVIQPVDKSICSIFSLRKPL